MTTKLVKDPAGNWVIDGTEGDPGAATARESSGRLAAYRVVVALQVSAPLESLLLHATLVEAEYRHMLYLAGVFGAFDPARDPAGFANQLLLIGPGPNNNVESTFIILNKLLQGTALTQQELDYGHTWAEGALYGIRRRLGMIRSANL